MSSNSIARCDSREIIPIYPCRYVISDDILLEDTEKLPQILTRPAGITQAPHHQLASMRQGYLYIYGNLSIDGRGVTDKGYWLVFRYQTRADDCNSPNETTACAKTFQYYQFTWKDGTARGRWDAQLMEAEPFAYVNTCAINTYIAYSEERWPAFMFETLERDETWRNKVMQPIDLHGEDPHTMSFDQLANIEDFKHIKPEEREANVLRHTPIGDLDITPFERMKDTHQERYSRARIVAIEDTLGEAKDLLRLAEVVEANIQAYETTHYYALSTAKAIAAVPYFEKDVERRYRKRGIFLWENVTYAARKIVSSDPFNRAADEQRHRFAKFGPSEREKSQKKIIELWSALDVTNRPRWHDEVRLALKGAKEEGCEKCIGFVASELGHYVSGIKLNSQAPATVLDKLKDNSEEDSIWANLLSTFVGVASEMVESIRDAQVLERMNRLFFELHTEIATTFYEGNSRIIVREMETLSGVVRRTQKISTGDLSNVAAQHYEVFLRGQMSNIFEQPVSAQTGSGMSNASVRQSMSQHLTLDYVAYEHVRDMSKGNLSLGLSGMSLVFAIYGAFGTVQKWHQANNFRARSKLSALANLPAVQLSVALSGVVAAASALYASPTLIRLVSDSGRLSARLAANLSGARVVIPERPTVGVSSGDMSRRAFIASVTGSVALAAGLLISIAQGYEGYKRSDYALMTGHALQAIGSIMMSSGLIGGFLSGSSFFALAIIGSKLSIAALPLAIIGGVLLAFGILFASVRRSELEQWVYEGFWGSSDQYWGDRRADGFDEQIERSIKLMNLESIHKSEGNELSTFFFHEMRTFEQAIWYIEVENIKYRDGYLKIYFPGLTDPDAVRQLSIRVERSQGSFFSSWEDTVDPRRVGGGRITAEWMGPGVAALNLSSYANQPRLRLGIRYERILPNGEKQSFSMVEPLIIEDPRQL